MPEFFIPARSSRHRTACFALYRALLQRAALVPLPPDLQPFSFSNLSKSPIRNAIRNSFLHNRQDTSPRLVVRALENGYKFLDVLSEAKTASSPANESIVVFLKNNAAATSSAKPPRLPFAKHKGKKQSTLPSAPHPDAVPLLTRRPVPGPEDDSPDARGPHQFYEYVSTARPLPLSQLSATKDGRRRVPVLATDATGIPFLRLGKPQSPVLSRIIRQKGRKRRDRAQLVSDLQRDELDFVAQEDAWEATVERFLEKKEAKSSYSKALKRQEPTYAGSVSVGINYLNNKLSVEQADMVARARAMLSIVDAERALAEEEEKELASKAPIHATSGQSEK